MKNVTKENKIKLALIAYNQITKYTPTEILYGKVKTDFPFEANKCYKDYLNQRKNNLKAINEVVKKRILDEKAKRQKTNFTLPQNIPKKVKIKVNKGNIQKIKNHCINYKK